MRIASVGRALPPHRHTQTEVLASLGQVWGDEPRMLERLAALHANTGVRTRHFALASSKLALATSVPKRMWGSSLYFSAQCAR